MTITHADDLDHLKIIGRIVANTMHAMAKAMEVGMTTRELDAIGRTLLDRAGATFCMGQVTAAQTKLCRDGRRAMEVGISQVGASKPIGGIGRGPLIVTLPG